MISAALDEEDIPRVPQASTLTYRTTRRAAQVSVQHVQRVSWCSRPSPHTSSTMLEGCLRRESLQLGVLDVFFRNRLAALQGDLCSSIDKCRGGSSRVLGR